MPLFDMVCQKCSNVFEYLKVGTWKNNPDAKCPKCGSVDVCKLISTPSIRMEGKRALRTMPDPVPPMQELRGKNAKGFEGGYQDLPEYNPTLKKKDGVWHAEEKKTQYFT